MNIHSPCRSEGCVRECLLGDDVILIEDDIAKQAPGLTLHGDIVHIVESVVRIVGIIILQVRPVAIDGAENAGLLAVQMLSIKYPELREKMKAYKAKMEEDILKIDAEMQE